MTPSGLSFIVLLVLVCKCDAGNIVLTYERLEGFDDGGLRLPLWEVVYHKSSINPQLRGVARIFLFGGANFESFGMVDEPIVEDVLPSFFGG